MPMTLDSLRSERRHISAKPSVSPLLRQQGVSVGHLRLSLDGSTNLATLSADLANNKVVLVLLAIFLPPLSAYLKTKDTQTTIINVVLTLLCGLPGIVHALYLVLKA